MNTFKNIQEKTLEEITDKACKHFENKKNITDKVKCRCGNLFTGRCEYELTGYKTGDKCNIKICKKCGKKIKEKTYCRVHFNALNKKNN